MSDLERARKAVEQQKLDADRRANLAQKLGSWYLQQLEENRWRATVERIVRGEG